MLWLAGHFRTEDDVDLELPWYKAFLAATVSQRYPVSDAEVRCFETSCRGVLKPQALDPNTRKKWAMNHPPPVVAACDCCSVKLTSNEVIEAQIQALRAKHGIPADALSEAAIDDIVRSAQPFHLVQPPPSLHASYAAFNAVAYEAAYKTVLATLMLRRTSVQTHCSTHRCSCFKGNARNGNRCDICRYLFPFEPDLLRWLGAEYLNAWNGACWCVRVCFYSLTNRGWLGVLTGLTHRAGRCAARHLAVQSRLPMCGRRHGDHVLFAQVRDQNAASH